AAIAQRLRVRVSSSVVDFGSALQQSSRSQFLSRRQLLVSAYHRPLSMPTSSSTHPAGMQNLSLPSCP
ncbi:unnamed protein product, partial [Mycena citricolor]